MIELSKASRHDNDILNKAELRKDAEMLEKVKATI